jgi:hypothetical protein
MQELAADLPNKSKELAELFYEYKVVYESHAAYEDGILFPAFEEFFPGCTEVVQHDHARDSVAVLELASLVAQLAPTVKPASSLVSHIHVEYKLHRHTKGEEAESSSSDNVTEKVRSAINAMVVGHNKHFDLEEAHLAPIARKFFGLQFGKVGCWVCFIKSCCRHVCCRVHCLCPQRLSRRMFESVPTNAWRKILPFVVNHMDIHPRRVAFLSTMVNSMPERAQLIGQMVYEGVPPSMWDRVSADVPQIIPRGVSGHWHLY